MSDTAYHFDGAMYDRIREGCQSSAEAVVPRVYDELVSAGAQVASVIDVGCGEGWWGAAFARQRRSGDRDKMVQSLGIDGAHVAAGTAAIPIVHAELERQGALYGSQPRSFDLAVCLEVAEHLQPKRAESFIAELCALAPVTLFSAAIPGQGGAGHINEQWPNYWAKLFSDHGRLVTGHLRLELWHDTRVEPWYRQNLLLAWTPAAVRLGAERRSWAIDDPPRSLVHPDVFTWRIAERDELARELRRRPERRATQKGW